MRSEAGEEAGDAKRRAMKRGGGQTLVWTIASLSSSAPAMSTPTMGTPSRSRDLIAAWTMITLAMLDRASFGSSGCIACRPS